MRNVRRILLFLPLLCVGASALKNIIHRVNEPKTWTEAQSYCRQHHIDLLSIRDEAENEEITLNGWIGLYREPTDSTWKWSETGVKANFRTWNSGEPDPGQYCGYKKAGDSGWHSKFCDDTFPFYCFDDPMFVSERMTWEEALEYCRHLTIWHPTVYQNHRYDLASPLAPGEDIYIQKMWPNIFKAWIGLRYLGDQWTWVNAQTYDELWEHCPIYFRCGTLERNVTLDIGKRMCNINNYFFCSRKSDIS